MNEKFILNVFDKFEKSSAVLLHIKEGEAELTLKKEAAYPNSTAIQPFALQNIPVQSAAGAETTGYTAPGACIANIPANGIAVSNAGMQGTAANLSAARSNFTGAPPADAAAVTSGTDANLVTVRSPIVGSFYRSPSPDAPAYVDKGSKVSKGQPLCILEAMKMMTEIKSDHAGIVSAINVKDGELVEVEQPLITLKED